MKCRVRFLQNENGTGHAGAPFYNVYNVLNVIVLAAGDESRWP
jgi:hypothetical protein